MDRTKQSVGVSAGEGPPCPYEIDRDGDDASAMATRPSFSTDDVDSVVVGMVAGVFTAAALVVGGFVLAYIVRMDAAVVFGFIVMAVGLGGVFVTRMGRRAVVPYVVTVVMGFGLFLVGMFFLLVGLSASV